MMRRRVSCYCPVCRKWWTQDWEEPDEFHRCGGEDPEEEEADQEEIT